jgi:hypothetical protein
MSIILRNVMIRFYYVLRYCQLGVIRLAGNLRSILIGFVIGPYIIWIYLKNNDYYEIVIILSSLSIILGLTIIGYCSIVSKLKLPSYKTI